MRVERLAAMPAHELGLGEGAAGMVKLDGTVAKDGALSGTMALVVHVKPKTRAPYDCTSPRVRVSAGR